MKPLSKNYKRIVIKIGSSLFGSTKESKHSKKESRHSSSECLDYALFKNLTRQISLLLAHKKEIVIVSSGAIALGMRRLGLKSRPKELSVLQASAAIGQNILMDRYSRAFEADKINCAQVLLTWEDFNDRKRYINAKNTLEALLKIGSMPIINENDTVSTDEIRFGDNDRLSAMVSSLISADLLIMLSDVDGLLDRDGVLCKTVEEITPEIKALASSTDKSTSVGGMITKLDAARIMMHSGSSCVIANGCSKDRQDIIVDIVEDPFSGGTWTLFSPKRVTLAARERWIAFGTKAKGRVYVDSGAKEALIKNNKSLLSPGVVDIKGDFRAGDTVLVVDSDNVEFARGKVDYSSEQLKEVKGLKTKKEVIHKDNLVII